MTGAVARLLDEGRRERDAATAALTFAQRHLANNEWDIDCRRAELAQLELVAHPPVPGRGPATRS